MLHARASLQATQQLYGKHKACNAQTVLFDTFLTTDKVKQSKFP